MQKRICAILLLLLLMLQTSAVVAEVTDDQPSIQVFIDDSAYQAVSKDGTKLDPLVVDGNLYLPLELVTRISGKTITWKQGENTLSIGSDSQSLPYMYLTELVPLNTSFQEAEVLEWNSAKHKDSDGNSYQTGIGTRILRKDGYYSYDYLLLKQYATFSGCYFLEYVSRAYAGVITLSFYGDGELLRSYDIHADSGPIYFDDIDVTDVTKLTIEFRGAQPGSTQPNVALGNPMLFYPDDYDVIGTVEVTSTRFVNVRSSGDVSGSVLQQIKPGSIYNAKAVTETGWYLIDLGDGVTGYVSPGTVTYTPKSFPTFP